MIVFLDYSAHAQSRECRTAALPDGTPAMFCKDKSGKWKQQAGEVEIQPLAATRGGMVFADAEYRGPAVYFIPIRQRQQRYRNLADVLLQQAAPTTQRREMFMTITMRIEGNAVNGTVLGGGWSTKVPMTGTRTGNQCNVTATSNGSTVVYVGPCDASGFRGSMTEYGTRGEALKGTFEFPAVSFTDTSARDARRAELKARCDSGSMTACVELDQLR